MTERGKRIMDNAIFERDQKSFFRKIESSTSHEEQIPEIEKFVEFWGDIWEKEERTPEMPWMEKVLEDLTRKINRVNVFDITEKSLTAESNKKKNWTAPGIDGIQNYWWKKFKSAQRALKRAFEKIRDNNELIPVWWPSGRTLLLPKTKDLSDEKKYCPITCLNTLYKLLTRLIGKYMRRCTMINDIWDKGQLGAVEGVLGTVDQLIIDRCIMEQVKSHHRNLAVAFYNYKKAYDKVHHDWMLRVYTWIGIPTNVVTLMRELMRKWKVRLEIWNDGEKKISRWINVLCSFLQGDSYSPVGFCLTETPVCNLLQETKGYRMGAPGARDVKLTHSLFVDDLKAYQESHKALRDANEMILQASHGTGGMLWCGKMRSDCFRAWKDGKK